MRTKSIYALALVLVSQAFSAQAEEDQYTFKVLNKTDSLITELLVSEDGKNWGSFDLGAGVAPGGEGTMAWDKSTDGQGCEQQVKAKYKGGTESETATFDFCEDDLKLEFS
jgi:hypothetical protein